MKRTIVNIALDFEHDDDESFNDKIADVIIKDLVIPDFEAHGSVIDWKLTTEPRVSDEQWKEIKDHM